LFVGVELVGVEHLKNKNCFLKKIYKIKNKPKGFVCRCRVDEVLFKKE